MASGIYAIRNTANGKVYIGSAVDLRRRKKEHLRAIALGNHENRHLRKESVEYGYDSFVFVVVERCESSKLIEREQHYLDLYKPFYSVGYNICRRAGNCLGVKHTKEARGKMSKARLGKPGYWLGKKRSDKTKEKIAESLFGRKPSQETLEKLRKRKPTKPMLGRKLSKEHRAAISAGNKGKKRSAETIEKLRVANLGKKASDETRKKMSESAFRRSGRASK